MLQDISQTMATLVATARAANHRYAVVLAGGRQWGIDTARAALARAGLTEILWLAAKAPDGIRPLAPEHAHTALGGEVDAAVIDTHTGFQLDAFGAIAGTIRGGGLLMLLTPPLDHWPQFSDPDYRRIAVTPYSTADVTGRFLRRLVRIIRADSSVVVCAEGAPPAPLPTPATAHVAWPAAAGEYRTPDQRDAVAAIIKVATGHRRRPVVLTSDRGRGKSAALGIAAARLLAQGVGPIVVTGPRLDAAATVFEHTRRLLPQAHASRAAVQLDQARMEFVSPDTLLHSPRQAQLLLVDEAAAIPTPLLERLLDRHARVAFATTVHGYEGTGRGFALRFHSSLDARTPGWRALRLETPVRWAAGDPLERFVFHALLLDASATPDTELTRVSPDAVAIDQLDRDSLADDEGTLAELFGLLVLAHYRTRPFDLRLLLDGPNVRVYVARHRGRVAATALVASEGALDAQLAHRIWTGRARPRGHLIPESLAAHVGLERAPLLRCARIMRIAVHPAAQNRGLGTRLLGAVVAAARGDGFDYVGSSFGLTHALLRFWARSDFTPVRLSVTRGAASGAHSAVMLRGLTGAGGALVTTACSRFFDQLPDQLSDPLRALEPSLTAHLLGAAPAPAELALDAQDWRDLVVFAFGRRDYEVCIAPLWKLTCTALSDPAGARVLSDSERGALVLKVVQKRNWDAVARSSGATGRAAAMDLLRAAARALLLHYGDAVVRAEIRRVSTLPPED